MFTLADGLTFCADNNREGACIRDVRIFWNILNDANLELHNMGRWDWQKRTSRLTFLAPYSTGTVSIPAPAGTPATFVGSANFTSADTGKFLRVSGEYLTYMTTFVNVTQLSLTPVRESLTAVAGATFELTNECVALPARFRCFLKPQIDDPLTPMVPRLLQDIMYLRKYYRLVGRPDRYAIEWRQAAGGLPLPYMWIYPANNVQRTIDIFWWQNPVTITSASVTTLGFDIPTEAEPYLRGFILARLQREQRVEQAQETHAFWRDQTLQGLATFRAVAESQQRDLWTPDADSEWVGMLPTNPLAPGEPKFI